MLKMLSLAWTTWKLTAKRFGPVGAAVVTAAVLGGYYLFLSDYLEAEHPELNRRLEQTV